MAIVPTARETAVLAHVLIDVPAWIAHAEAVFGEEKAREFMAEKVAKYAADYDAAVAADGEAYQTRAEREAGNA